MARNLEVKLELLASDFNKRLDKLEKQLGSVKDVKPQVDVDTKKAEKNIKSLSQKMESVGKTATELGSKLTTRVTAPLTALAGLSLKTFSDFDDQIRKVGATSGAVGEDFQLLTDKAKELGSTTRFSATEAAEGLEFMALAGFDTNESLSAIDGTLNLAAAAAIDLGAAADITTDTMSAFGESADQANRFADVFAATQAKSNTNVLQLGEALKTAAPQASAFGASIETTNALLGKLADAGVKGSRAGTVLNATFRDLKGAAEDGKVAIGDTQIALADSEGNFRDIVDILSDVENATGGMSQAAKDAALSGIFKEESIKGINILMQQGTDSVRGLREELLNSGGAAKTAADRLEGGLGGAFRSLKSSAEGALIEIGEVLAPLAAKIANALQSAFSFFSNLDSDTKQLIVTIGGVVAAVGPAVLAFGKLTSIMPAVIASVKALTAAAAANPIGLLAIGIAAAIPLGFALADAFSESTEEALENTKAQGELIEKKKELVKADKEQAKTNRDLIAEYQKTGKRVDELRNKENLSGKEKEELSKKTLELQKQQNALNKEYPEAIDGSKSFAENLKSVKEETGLQNAQLEKLDDNTKKLIKNFEELGEKENKTAEEKKELSRITDELKIKFPEAGISADDFSGSLDRVKRSAGIAFGELDRLDNKLSDLGKQQAENRLKEITQEFKLINEGASDALDEISTLFSQSGKQAKDLAKGEFFDLKKEIQSIWDVGELDSNEIQKQIADFESILLDAGSDIDKETRQSLLKFVDQTIALQKERIEFNKGVKGTSEAIDENNEGLEETAKNLDNANKSVKSTAKELKDLSGIRLGDFDIDFALPDFKEKLELKPIKDFEDAVTGISIKEENLSSIDRFIDGIDKAIGQVKILQSNLQSSPQFIEELVKGNEDLTSSLRSEIDATNSTIKGLESNLTGLKLDFDEAGSQEERQRIAAEILQTNQELQDELIKAAKARGQDVTTIERSLGIERGKVEKEATKTVNTELDKQLEALEGKKDKAVKIRKEQAEQTIKVAGDETKKEISLFEQIGQDATASLLKGFNNLDVSGFISNNKQVEDSIKDLNNSYEEDTESLKEQLENKEITQREYYEQIEELEEEHNSKLSELNDERIGFFDVFAQGISNSFANLSLALSEQVSQIASSYDKWGEDTELTKEKISTAYQLTAANALSSFASLAAGGENLGTALAKSALSALDALIPVLVAQITGISLAQPDSVTTFGATGFARAAALTAILKGIVAGARAAVGAEEGVLGITKSYNKKPGRTDNIPAMLAVGETVLTADETKKYRPLIEGIRKDNIDSSILSKYSDKEINMMFNQRQISSNNDTNKELRATRRELQGLREDVRNQTKRIHAEIFNRNSNEVKVKVEPPDNWRY